MNNDESTSACKVRDQAQGFKTRVNLIDGCQWSPAELRAQLNLINNHQEKEPQYLQACPLPFIKCHDLHSAKLSVEQH